MTIALRPNFDPKAAGSRLVLLCSGTRLRLQRSSSGRDFPKPPYPARNPITIPASAAAARKSRRTLERDPHLRIGSTQTREDAMLPTDLDRTFPGTLYAGDGARLAGAGPCAFTPKMNAGLPFKALVSGSPPAPDSDVLTLEDRLWVLPPRFSTPEVVPTPLLYQLASLIRAGGKVGLASADELVCDQARDMLMLVLARPDGDA